MLRTPSKVNIEIGQKWVEVDPRFTRIVEVAGWDWIKGKVQIKCGHRLTWAKLSRFNGKRTGYALYNNP